MQSYRSEWLSVLKANPNASRQQLMDVANFLYLWLRKNDSKWIEAHLPHPRKFVNKTPLLDWKSIDTDLSGKVKAATIRIRNLPGRPVRVCITAIIREVGHKSWLENRLHNMPRTAKILSENLESLEIWAIWKVKWVENCFSQEGLCPTRHSLAVKAGLRTQTGMLPRVQSAIDEAMVRLCGRIQH